MSCNEICGLHSECVDEVCRCMDTWHKVGDLYVSSDCEYSEIVTSFMYAVYITSMVVLFLATFFEKKQQNIYEFKKTAIRDSVIIRKSQLSKTFETMNEKKFYQKIYNQIRIHLLIMILFCILKTLLDVKLKSCMVCDFSIENVVSLLCCVGLIIYQLIISNFIHNLTIRNQIKIQSEISKQKRSKYFMYFLSFLSILSPLSLCLDSFSVLLFLGIECVVSIFRLLITYRIKKSKQNKKIILLLQCCLISSIISTTLNLIFRNLIPHILVTQWIFNTIMIGLMC